MQLLSGIDRWQYWLTECFCACRTNTHTQTCTTYNCALAFWFVQQNVRKCINYLQCNEGWRDVECDEGERNQLSLLEGFQIQYFSHNGCSERICWKFTADILLDRNFIFLSIRLNPVRLIWGPFFPTHHKSWRPNCGQFSSSYIFFILRNKVGRKKS